VNFQRNSFKLDSWFVDPPFLKIFNYKYIYGDPQTALSEPKSILITETTANRLFGQSNPIGQVIKWDNREGLKVTAVIRDLPGNQSIQFDALTSWSFFLMENPEYKRSGWGNGFSNTVIKLKNNSAFATADAEIRKLIMKHSVPQDRTEAFLFPFDKTHLYTAFEKGKPVGGKIDQVKLFLFLACCVLVIACINYMNLSTARSEKRAREVGVRKALGSSRKAIAGQFMLESLILSLVAMVIAFVLLELCLPYFNNLLQINMTVDYRSVKFWSGLILLVLTTGLLAGSYPSFYLSSFVPIKVLKGFAGIGRASLSIRKMLVIVQFVCSVCMIICAIIIYKQIRFIKDKPLGFDKENLVQMEAVGEFRDRMKLNVFQTELIKSGVILSGTGYSTGLTNGGNNSADIVWDGHPEHWKYSWNNRITGYDFAQTIGVKFLAGRDFNVKFGTDTNGVLLNEAAAKVLGFKNPIGKTITKQQKQFTIIGVFKDFSYQSAAYKVAPTLTFLATSETPDRPINIEILRLNPAQNLSKSIQVIKELSSRMNPAYPAELYFVDKDMEDQLSSERLLSVLSNLFGGFAILISCLGLFGLALYMVEQRSREISIRKVLGANLSNILLLLNKDFMKLVLISNLIACPLAYIIGYKWIQQFDYRATITLWPMIITVGLSLLVALLTVSLQTFKVARANPVDALKYE
jgi:putative ABC transport system permease protein